MEKESIIITEEISIHCYGENCNNNGENTMRVWYKEISFCTGCLRKLNVAIKNHLEFLDDGVVIKESPVKNFE